MFPPCSASSFVVINLVFNMNQNSDTKNIAIQEQGPWAGLKRLVVTRLIEFVRRPEAIFWVYVFPLLMVLVLGIAFRSKPVEKITVDLQSGADSVWLSEFEAAVKSDERINFQTFDEKECRQRLKSGKSDLYLRRADDGKIEYVFDETRPGSVAAKEMVNRLQLVHRWKQKSDEQSDLIGSRDITFQEPGGRYIDWLIPGLLGMGLMGGGLWGVGFAIVDMRIRKLLKRFLATPMKRSHYLVSIMISRLLFMIPEMILLVLFARFIFGVQIFGSVVDVVLLILIGAIQFSGIGLLIAARCRTMEAVSGMMNLTMLPMWTLSGIFFSYERFPEVVHPLIKMLPLTPLIDSLRAVMVDGTSIVALWPELLIMTLWSVVSFAIALWIFRWGD